MIDLPGPVAENRAPVRSFRPLSGIPAIAAACLAACGGGDDVSTDPPGETPTGTVRVSAVTTGDTPDVDGYTVTLDGSDARTVDPDGTVTFLDVAEGVHEVALSGIQVNCAAAGATLRSVSVTAAGTSSVEFAVACRAALLDRIVFVSDRDGDFDLYSMAPDGSGVTRVTDSAARDLTPDVSSDGTRVVFDRLESDNLEVYLLEVGGDARNLTGHPDRDIHPVLSPDGSRIAFSSDRSGDLEIWTMAPDGSDAQRLTADPELDVEPAWSPDGNRIAFTSGRSGSRDVYVMDADGTNLIRLTDDPGTDESPAWSPDGQRIAFSSNRTGEYQIWLMNADGTGSTRLTDVPEWDGSPAPSPDGQRIAFASERTAVGDVFLVAADGSGLVRLTESGGFDGQPVWTPAR